MESPPLILVSNDDGYISQGLKAFAAELRTWADVVVVAPESEQSSKSHSLTLHRPLRTRQVEPAVFAVDGTPADCIYLALHASDRFLPRTPDLVCSGINHGLNLGQDAFYSGTIAAAREGSLRSIPALAVSAHVAADLQSAASLAAKIAKKMLGNGWPKAAPGKYTATLLSLNVPRDWKGHVRATRLGSRIYEEVVDVRLDPRGREYVWIGGPGVHHDRDEGSDTDAYDQGVASLTPLLLDLTKTSALEACTALLAELDP